MKRKPLIFIHQSKKVYNLKLLLTNFLFIDKKASIVGKARENKLEKKAKNVDKRKKIKKKKKFHKKMKKMF